MKSNNNRNNRYQNEQNKNNKQNEQNINNFNLGKSHRNFGSAFSNLSDSTFGNFNPISNIGDSKLKILLKKIQSQFIIKNQKKNQKKNLK